MRNEEHNSKFTRSILLLASFTAPYITKLNCLDSYPAYGVTKKHASCVLIDVQIYLDT